MVANVLVDNRTSTPLLALVDAVEPDLVLLVRYLIERHRSPCWNSLCSTTSDRTIFRSSWPFATTRALLPVNRRQRQSRPTLLRPEGRGVVSVVTEKRCVVSTPKAGLELRLRATGLASLVAGTSPGYGRTRRPSPPFHW